MAARVSLKNSSPNGLYGPHGLKATELPKHHHLFLDIETDSTKVNLPLNENKITTKPINFFLQVLAEESKESKDPAYRFREGNKVAHLLTTDATKNIPDDQLLFWEAPPYVLHSYKEVEEQYSTIVAVDM
ncbi:hypothetical protein HAX54_017523 [Datura stramonium]|uniref:Uncharacterized protein n=1 Tax=Datura stramonium TaxID=4076 RepID=A0ABS8UMD2_DATST|nr:hypothetical protein [Datura stramonium]